MEQQSLWHILMIDDDGEDYLLTKLLFNEIKSRKVDIEWASSYQAGKERLQSEQFDVVLIDYDLGSKTGIELIREMVSTGYPAPLILYTGRGNYEVDLEAQRAGATLYLTKDEATPLLLERFIRYAIERKQIEVQLLASQIEAVRERNMLQSVMESLPIGVAIIDPEGGTIRANAGFENVWGGPRPITHSIKDYAAYKAWWVESGRQVEPEEWASARAILNGETVVGQFLKVERFDGSQVFVLNSAAPIFDGNTKAVGCSVAIMDITDHVQTEQALFESKEHYRLLNYSMLNGYALHEMIFDNQGKPVDYRFIEVNPAFEELTGLKAENILGKTVMEVLPETEKYWIETYGQVVLTGKTIRFENYHHTLERYFEVVAFTPRPNHFAVVFTDITKHHRAE